MSLKKILKEESENFQLSYQVPYNRIPHLIDQMEKQMPNLKVKEYENGDIVVFNPETEQAILKYDYDTKILNSDMTYVQLVNMKDE